ncbi:hypothetical protein [Devosia sp. Root105]|uniref:hypothetical protein n=1 Tax=Devosia sp. Root105 TaxID=1736423 RepID=UPI0012E384D0|nr:hypothetical protein [Devosia sp. Root105]
MKIEKADLLTSNRQQLGYSTVFPRHDESLCILREDVRRREIERASHEADKVCRVPGRYVVNVKWVRRRQLGQTADRLAQEQEIKRSGAIRRPT